jgi:hypothetical protein
MPKYIATPLVVASAALLLAACGGDDNSTNLAEIGDPPTPLVNVNPDGNNTNPNDEDESVESAGLPILPGYYSTTVVINDGSEATGATIIDSDGRFTTFIPDTDITLGVMRGEPDNQISGEGFNTAYNGSSWEQNSGTLTGNAENDSSATFFLDASTSDYESVVSISRSVEYSDNSITLGQVSGTFLMDEAGWLTTEITIQEDGSITGNDESGCTFLGEATIPDPSYSILRISFSADNCPDADTATAEQRSGLYSGLGVFTTDNSLIIFASNETVAAYFNGAK